MELGFSIKSGNSHFILLHAPFYLSEHWSGKTLTQIRFFDFSQRLRLFLWNCLCFRCNTMRMYDFTQARLSSEISFFVYLYRCCSARRRRWRRFQDNWFGRLWRGTTLFWWRSLEGEQLVFSSAKRPTIYTIWTPTSILVSHLKYSD